MGKNIRARVKNPETMKMVYTHGKKRNAIANAVVQEGKGTITVNVFQFKTLNQKFFALKSLNQFLFLVLTILRTFVSRLE